MRTMMRSSFGGAPPAMGSYARILNAHRAQGLNLQHMIAIDITSGQFEKTASSRCPSSASSSEPNSMSCSVLQARHSQKHTALSISPFYSCRDDRAEALRIFASSLKCNESFSSGKCIRQFSVLSHFQGVDGFGAIERTRVCRWEGFRNFNAQSFERRARRRDSEGGNSKQMIDLDPLEVAAQKQGYDLHRLQELQQRATQSELENAVNAYAKAKQVSQRPSSGNEAMHEESKSHDEQSSEKDAERSNYLLNVQAIRNKVPESRAGGASNRVADEDEIKVFEEWAAMKVRAEGASIAPVIEEMRIALIQRVKEASQAQEAGATSTVKPTEFPRTRSRPPKLPIERDPLAGVPVKPIMVKRRSKVPEDWNGPGGVVVLIDKPKGWSSFAVCDKLRQLLKIRKVGHAGTLDPLSTGLLVVCVGKATKLADSYQAMTKVYSGTMRLGETTPSLDAGTPVSETLPWEHIQEMDVRRAVDSFLGDITQVPPMYSAIKVKGERLYSKARRGEEIKVPARNVTVFEFQLERSVHNRQDWDFWIICSKGTYIRSLCADLARSLNSCAHLTALRREKIGNLSVEDAWPISELETYYKDLLRMPKQVL